MIIRNTASDNKLGELAYEFSHNGPTLWEKGIAHRTAREFYVPDPNPDYINPLYLNHTDRFRQYGMWERYSELYPVEDLVFTVGQNDYQTDWFFLQVTRPAFSMNSRSKHMQHDLKTAFASGSRYGAWLRSAREDKRSKPPLFFTRIIGKDNTIARHGTHGLYRLFSVDVPGSILAIGENAIFLTLAADRSPFQGIMHDYIRFEAPPLSVYPQGV